MKEKFIDKSIRIYMNKYDYSLVEYVDSKTKVKIICQIHGIFEKTPANHIRNKNRQGCQKCSVKIRSEIIKKPINDFIKNSIEIHGDKYDYSLVEYNNMHDKVNIICKIHGIFEQRPCNHIYSKNGCPLCVNNNIKLTTDDFIKKAKKIHGDKYDYSLVKYENNKKNVKIKIENMVYEQSPSSHLKGFDISGFENISKGETIISKILDSNNIKYYRQKTYSDFKFKNKLRFDFYLPEHNTCIEYDGIQHFEPINFFGGLKSLKHNQKIDKLKNEYCKNNNIKLLRIKYNQNIEDKIKELVFDKR